MMLVYAVEDRMLEIGGALSSITVGVTGCGRIAERHLHAYSKMPDVKVILADQSPAAAAQLASSFDVEWRQAPQDLLDKDVDAIDVCVPTVAHADVVLAALEAEKHVFCEKPLCHTLEQAQRIAQAQERVRRQVMVGYLYRFHPALQFMKQVLADGAIGRPYFAIFRLGGRGDHRAWKHTAESGGGATLEMMVHNLDLVLWLLGDIEHAERLRRRTLLPERVIDGQVLLVDAEDYVLASLQAGGAEVLCESDLVTPSYMSYAEVHGDNGSVFSSILHFLPTVVYCREARGMFNLGNTMQQFPIVNLFEREIGYFIQALREEVLPMNGVADSLQILAAVEQIRKGGNAQ